MKIAICEDDDKWLFVTEQYLEKFKTIHKNISWDVFSNAEELMDYCTHNPDESFDMLITDIEMDGMNGIELAQKMRDADSGMVIIFLSSHDEYIRQCFKPSPLNFWDKPVSYDQFSSDMEEAIELVKKCNTVFPVKTSEGYIRIPFKRIIYFETTGKKIIAHTVQGEYVFNGSFNEYNNIWRSAGFVKINRNYFVNEDFVEKFADQKLTLTNGTILSVSSVHSKNVRMALFDKLCADIRHHQNKTGDQS